MYQETADPIPEKTPRERFLPVFRLVLFLALVVAAPIFLALNAGEIRLLADALETPSGGNGAMPTLDAPLVVPPGVAVADRNDSTPSGADPANARAEPGAILSSDTCETSPTPKALFQAHPSAAE